MGIAGMVIWVLTAGIGIYLLAAGIAAQRAAASPETAAATEGSPLLEFTHPALALVGLTFWIFFVMTGGRVFAWVAFGVVVATVAAGVSWDLSRRRAGRGEPDSPRPARPGFPPHLIAAHAVAAACTFALVVLSAAAAGHG